MNTVQLEYQMKTVQMVLSTQVKNPTVWQRMKGKKQISKLVTPPNGPFSRIYAMHFQLSEQILQHIWNQNITIQANLDRIQMGMEKVVTCYVLPMEVYVLLGYLSLWSVAGGVIVITLVHGLYDNSNHCVLILIPVVILLVDVTYSPWLMNLPPRIFEEPFHHNHISLGKCQWHSYITQFRGRNGFQWKVLYHNWWTVYLTVIDSRMGLYWRLVSGRDCHPLRYTDISLCISPNHASTNYLLVCDIKYSIPG